MALGIGVDLVAQSRIAKAIEKFGDRFARKILTKDEFERYAKATSKTNFLSKQFAAKEAVVKALGTGFAQGISWQHVSIHRAKSTQPAVTLSDKAQERLEHLGGTRVLISLADEGDTVIAFAQIS